MTTVETALETGAVVFVTVETGCEAGLEVDGAGFETTAGADEVTLLVAGATLVTVEVVGAVFDVLEVVAATVTGAVEIVCDTTGAVLTVVLLTLVIADDVVVLVVVLTVDVLGTLAPPGNVCAAAPALVTSIRLITAITAISPVRVIQRRPVRPLTASSPDVWCGARGTLW